MIQFPDIEPDAATFSIQANTTSFESELNASVQHASMPGDKWIFTLTFTNRARQDGRKLAAWLAALGGPTGRFEMSPPDLDQQGTLSGAGIVDGAGQTGSTLNTTGWTVNQSALAVAGDYITVNGELKMITADAASDANGDAVLSIAPPLRKSPANGASITVDNPKGKFYLVDDNQAAWRLSAPYIYAISFAGEEDVV